MRFTLNINRPWPWIHTFIFFIPAARFDHGDGMQYAARYVILALVIADGLHALERLVAGAECSVWQ